MAEQWYYTSNGEPTGPVEVGDLQRLASAGQLQPSDLVWREGMALWMPAGETRGLFREVRQEYVPPPASAAPAASAPPEVIPVEPAYPSASGPYAGPRRPPRRPPERGMSTGAKVALFGGIAAGVVVLVVIIVLVSLAGQQRGDSGSYVLNLQAQQRDVRFFRFVAGRQVTITVTSDFNTDVDLFVYDSFGRRVAWDTRIDPNCRVTFRPQRTEMYRVEVVNLGPGFNRSVVRYN
jgi:hypothetical protein